MATEVIVPKVDMVMETGTFVEWLVKEGGQVSKGDPLFVITTDKAAIEVESPADGILAGATAKVDDVIPVTEVIGYILEPGEELPTKKAASLPAVPAPSALVKTEAKVEMVVAAAPSVGSDKARATPVARRMAEKLGVDLNQIPGRGPKGRIHKADVLAYQKPQVSSAPLATQMPVGQSAIQQPNKRRNGISLKVIYLAANCIFINKADGWMIWIKKFQPFS